MTKERRMNSSPLNQATISPYSHSLKFSDSDNYDNSFPHFGDEQEWEEAKCPICMEHPHNAVLLLCSSHDRGCRPFICDTSYRHSNCLDQFRKSAAANRSFSQTPLGEHESELLCPLCRGTITGWNVVPLARRYMDSRTRSCSLETCSFSGNYTELRKHARLEHPSKRPSEASPTRQSNWVAMERQRDIEDALAYHSDIDYDWGEESFLSNGSFFDFQSGMSDIEDSFIDEMFVGISLSVFSMYSSSSEEEMMHSGSSRSSDRPQIPTNSGSTSNTNQVGNVSISLRAENMANVSSSTSGFRREDDVINMQSRSSPIHSYHRENMQSRSSPIHSYHRENMQSRSSPIHNYHRVNASTRSRIGSGYNRANDLNISRTRSSYNQVNGNNISRSRSNNHRENAPARLRTRLSHHHREQRIQPSSLPRPSYYQREVVRSVTRQPGTRQLPGSYRRPHSRYYQCEVYPWVGQASTTQVGGSSRQPHLRYYQPATRHIPNSYGRRYSRYYHSTTRHLH